MPPASERESSPTGVECAYRWLRTALVSRRGRTLAALVTVGVAVWLVVIELHTSRFQARWLSGVAATASYAVAPGPSDAIRFPAFGPHNWRLGYARLPAFLEHLEDADYRIEAQARSSPGFVHLVDRGLYPIYEEKSQAGLRIVDRAGHTVFERRYPTRVYEHFVDIPPLVVETLLFLENRELLDEGAPYRNPAVEWDRLLRAGLYLGMRQVDSSVPRLGGSTLATQLEKIRHSPDGMTSSLREKIRQIASASVRAYRRGERTLESQRRIVTAYLNAMPLAARPGYGEVIGIGDGLWVWYGAEFEQVNYHLHQLSQDSAYVSNVSAARAYRQVVSLLVAIRRPSDYLVARPASLVRDTDTVLSDLQREGIVTARLATLARTVSAPRRESIEPPPVSFVELKPAIAVRVSLAESLGVETLYELDRLDLTVTTTLDRAVQEAVTATLQQLGDPEYVVTTGLRGDRLLQSADPGRVVYSVLLFERGPTVNLLRVQTDNLDRPLDVNEATKLELGSTAKLRTLVTYLEVIEALYAEYAGRSPTEIAAARAAASDPLTRWVLDQVTREAALGLPTLLEVALERRYSASPDEVFSTGGGLHRFTNYDSDDNGRVMTVREGFRQSVNLVFIRLLRDIVRYHLVRLPDWSPTLLDDRAHPGRIRYLQQFADREGRVFLDRFLRKYDGLSGDEAMTRLADDGPQTLSRLATIHRSVRPKASATEFDAFLRARVDPAIVEERGSRLYEEYRPERLSLADRGFLARQHPLELWLVADRIQHPDARRSDVMDRSVEVRQQSYRWLFRTSRKHAQDRRIRSELEREAFGEIHRAWQRLGYPFSRLVPSYATAIGSSGDNPAGLAQLMGIIQNGGTHYPAARVTQLRFGEGTPTETWLTSSRAHPESRLNPTLASIVRQELIGVVEHGTGRRAAGSVVLEDGTPVVIGGKTGTGDNRVAAAAGTHQTGRVLNRTATFVFLIGDRFYGVVTAYVDGWQAADYRFTSALPVQVFKQLVPAFLPLLTTGAVPGAALPPDAAVYPAI